MEEPKIKVKIITVKYLDVKPEANGMRILKDEKWYEEECLSDLGKEPKIMWILVRHFVLKVGKTGRPILTNEREVVEIADKSHVEMVEKLEKLTEEYDGIVPEGVDINWIPEDILELKNAIKSGALKV